ncbi:MAG: DUF4411 family protein [Leptolyngbya sp. DLM2.Bin15]|nr:MAG: DUF4411 family protein [Leptolyngbya sp. DLM2.Bin15]
MIYVFDTNSLSVLKNFYPANFPSFWQKWNELVSNGVILSVREVKRELDHRDRTDFLQAWFKQNKAIFATPSPEELMVVQQILAIPRFQPLIGTQATLRGTPVADPFIVAAAKIKDGVVITEERLKPNAAKIPNVCEHFKVPCTNLEGFMSQQNWSF